MNVISFLQVIEELLAHLPPDGLVDIVEDIFAFAVGGDEVGVSEKRKVVADGGLIHVQRFSDFVDPARPFFGQEQHNAKLTFFTN